MLTGKLLYRDSHLDKGNPTWPGYLMGYSGDQGKTHKVACQLWGIKTSTTITIRNDSLVTLYLQYSNHEVGVNFNHVTKYTTQGAEVLSHKHKRLLCQTLKCFTRIKSGDNLQENTIFTDEEIKVTTSPRSHNFRAGNRLKLSLLPWVKNFKLSLSKLDLGFINYSGHSRDHIKHVIWTIRIIEQTLKGTHVLSQTASTFTCLSEPEA